MNPKITDNTLLDARRLERLQAYAELTDGMAGDYAEVGAYKGGSAYLLANTIEHGTLYVIDTFTGMPSVGILDDHKEGDFKDTSLEAVQELLAPFKSWIEILQGVFPDVRPPDDAKFALVHLDCDLYSSVKAGLEFFAPRMQPGGFIVLDDVFAFDCLGALEAAQEFEKETGQLIVAQCESQGVFRF